jgi:uncharacterized membrane protein
MALTGSLAFGSVQVGATATAQLTITNSGNTTLTVTGIAVPSGYAANWTSGTIAPGASRYVTVTFAPAAAQTYNGTLVVNADQTGGTNTTAVSGTGTAPPTRIISLTGNLAFGSVQVGATATAQLTITNSGNATLTVTGIAVPIGYAANWTSGTIAPGASRYVTITFAPAAAQTYNGTLVVNADQTGGTNTIAVSGTGTAPPTRIISLTGNLAFGSVQVGATTTAQLTITNSGNATLTVTGMTGPSGYAASWTSGTIAPGASQYVTVTFAPTAAQTYNGVLTVVANHTSGTNTIGISGTGVSAPPAPSVFHVWGGPGYSVYLGYFTCTFCTEYGSDSINNQYGSYGSAYSSTSIRNPYSQYGSQYSSYSACNPYTSTPPRVYNADGSIYYGQLTVNTYNSQAIRELVSWLEYDVCK